MNTSASSRPGDRLTERELEILTAMANGHKAERIARALHISPNTVKSHASRIYRKLGAADSTHAVALAIATRQLPPRVVQIVIQPTPAQAA